MTNEERVQMVIKEAEQSSALRRTVGQSLAEPLVELANNIAAVLGSGHKLLICGNGGSAADSSHMAAEMIVRLTGERNRASLPAISLTADTSILTAAGNDFGFEHIFARQIEGLGQQGDMLLVISILGGDGGKIAPLADKKLIIPHSSVQRIQEEQIFLIHLLVELIESDLFQ